MKYDYLVIAGLETVWRRYQPHHVPRTAGRRTIPYMWLFRSGEDGEPSIIIYKYSSNAGQGQCEEFWKGSLDI